MFTGASRDVEHVPSYKSHRVKREEFDLALQHWCNTVDTQYVWEGRAVQFLLPDCQSVCFGTFCLQATDTHQPPR